MKKLVKILSIDGGGVRGIIPLYILAEIEKKTGKRVAKMFDLIAGNSTGGIISLMLTMPGSDGKPKFSAEEIVNLYEKFGKGAFEKSVSRWVMSLGGLIREKYDLEGIAEVGERIFGNTRLSEATTELLIASFDLEQNKPFFFKRRQAKLDEALDFKFIDMARATTAAPTYVKPFVIDKPHDPLVKHYVFLDGGVIANNPAMCAYVEAKSTFPLSTDYMLVSLGTGDYLEQVLLEDVKDWGALQWLKPLVQVFINGQGKLVDHQLKTLFETSGDPLNHYFRLQVRLHLDEAPMDDTSEIKFHELGLLGVDTVKQNADNISEICKILT